MNNHQIVGRRAVPALILGIWLLLIGGWLLTSLDHQSVQALASVACPQNATIPIGQTPLVASIQHAQVTEGGEPFTYTIALCSKPDSPVTVLLQLDPIAVKQISITKPISYSLVFTAGNYDILQVVEIEARDDGSAEPISQTGVISHTSASEDPNFSFNANQLPRVEVVILDNDTEAHLPIVLLEHTPTPTPTPSPTPTLPPAQWQHVNNTANRDVDVIVGRQGQLIAGDRTKANAQKGIYSVDGCTSNANYQPILTGPDIRDLAKLGSDWLAGTNGQRVYYSATPLTAWQPTSSAMNANVFAVAFVTTTLAYAGADDGIYQSSNKGEQWTKIDGSPGLINEFRYDPASQILWIATYGNGVYTLAENGQFTQFVDGLPNANTDRRVWDIVQHAGQTYIATTNGVYVQDESSDAWQRFGPQLEGVQVLSLEIVPVAGVDQLIAGTINRGIWYTTFDNPAWVNDDSFQAITVGDLLYDATGEFCPLLGGTRPALLAATVNGVYIYQ